MDFNQRKAAMQNQKKRKKSKQQSLLSKVLLFVQQKLMQKCERMIENTVAKLLKAYIPIT